MRLTINLSLHFFLSLFFVVAQERYTSNINDKKLGNLEIKNYTNKFLERPESVWSVLRSSKSKKIFYGTYGGVLEYDGINVKSIEIDGPIENEIRTSFTRTLLEDQNKNIYAAGGGFFGKIMNSDFGGSEYVSLMEKIPDTINPYIQVFWEVLTKKMTFICIRVT